MDTTHTSMQDGGRIGFLADTHCRSGDGLPAAVLDAFRGVDLIVHLGDMGVAGVLDRLQTVAPVLATRGGDDPAEDSRIAPTRLIDAGGLTIGALFDLSQTSLTVTEAGRLMFPSRPVHDALSSTFARRVEVVVFAATHRDLIAHHGGVLFVNPGSATLPAQPGPSGLGTVAILDVRDRVAIVEMIHL